MHIGREKCDQRNRPPDHHFAKMCQNVKEKSYLCTQNPKVHLASKRNLILRLIATDALLIEERVLTVCVHKGTGTFCTRRSAHSAA